MTSGWRTIERNRQSPPCLAGYVGRDQFPVALEVGDIGAGGLDFFFSDGDGPRCQFRADLVLIPDAAAAAC